jgi:hypothetical protein
MVCVENRLKGALHSSIVTPGFNRPATFNRTVWRGEERSSSRGRAHLRLSVIESGVVRQPDSSMNAAGITPTIVNGRPFSDTRAERRAAGFRRRRQSRSLIDHRIRLGHIRPPNRAAGCERDAEHVEARRDHLRAWRRLRPRRC